MTFNRRSSHGHHGSKRREPAQHAHSRASHAFTHTLTSTQTQPLCPKRQLRYYRIWNQIFILKVPEGGGSKPEYPEKSPDSLPANRYHNIRGENPTSWTGLEPSPSNIGDRLAWPTAHTKSHPTQLQTATGVYMIVHSTLT